MVGMSTVHDPGEIAEDSMISTIIGGTRLDTARNSFFDRLTQRVF